MIVDCAVHPVLDDTSFAGALGPPWNLAKLPSLVGDVYAPPFEQILPSGGDPAAVAHVLLEQRGADVAVLAPSTRGYFPNPQQAAAVAHAANVVLRADWLDAPCAAERFLGSIRVAVGEAVTAVGEIQDWARDRRFVQVVVPLRSLAPYGDENYFPIWRAAAEAGLPVFIHDDLGSLVEFPPTSVGFPRYVAEHHALRPMLAVVHIASLITCGVFNRLPELRVVIGDGGVEVCRALLLRLDKDWRSGRVEIPWVEELPSSFLDRHVRFVGQAEDARPDAPAGSSSLLLFGSRYPYWDGTNRHDAFSSLPTEQRQKVLGANAVSFYPRVAARVPAVA